MTITCDCDVTAPGMWIQFPRSSSESGWVRDYVDVDKTLISSTDLVTLAS